MTANRTGPDSNGSIQALKVYPTTYSKATLAAESEAVDN